MNTRIRKQFVTRSLCTAAALAFLLLAQTCTPVIPSLTFPEGVTKIVFLSGKKEKQITLAGLTGQNVYLVKVNTSDNPVAAGNTGHAFAAPLSRRSVTDAPFPFESLLPSGGDTRPVSGVFTTGAGDTITRYDHPGAQAFNSDPPPAGKMAGPSVQAARSVLERAVPYTVGDASPFWVENARGAWIAIDTTLRATGDHSNIWVADANFDSSSGHATDNKITEVQAAVLAQQFDAIYGLETRVFGYEYGGGPGGDGGVDGDPKIQILVYDIDFDYFPAQTSGTLGYFWSKDFYDQAWLDEFYGSGAYMTNKAELFYIDAYFMDWNPELSDSTLVHEFQHMINFNVKFIKNKKHSDTWYDEMLSMLAEDMIGPLTGIAVNSSGHVIQERMPSFLAGYLQSGVKDWLSGNTVLYSYAGAYAFGAYLVRNFGGAELVKAMMENSTTNEASITAALSRFVSGMTFKNALSRYGEALAYSGGALPEGVFSFDKTITKKIGGTSYTFTRFDIWEMRNALAEKTVTVGDAQYTFPAKGPAVWPLAYDFAMRGNSVLLQSAGDWQGVTGDLTVTAQRPADSNVELYLMVR